MPRMPSAQPPVATSTIDSAGSSACDTTSQTNPSESDGIAPAAIAAEDRQQRQLERQQVHQDQAEQEERDRVQCP